MLIPIARKSETLKILYSHALLISVKFLQVQKSIDAQTKVELNIPQLTLAMIAQLGRHGTVIEELPKL